MNRPLLCVGTLGMASPSTTAGIHIGLNNGSSTSYNIENCCGSATGNGYLYFTNSINSTYGYIRFNHSSGSMIFYTNSGSHNMTLSSAGVFTCTGTKSFDILHPNVEKAAQGYRLRHRCIESEKAMNFYRGQHQCSKKGPNKFSLPKWMSEINVNFTVMVTPYKCLGAAWGDVVNDNLEITCSEDGIYNVLILGDRSDKIATGEYNEYGVEYISKEEPEEE